MVLVNLSVDPAQDQCVGDAVESRYRGELQHRLDDEAQADAGHAGTPTESKAVWSN